MLLQRALAVRECEYGREHHQVTSTLGNLGIAYAQLGDARKAAEFMERALAIQEREYGW